MIAGRYAAIDCGTNAVRLLVCDVDADGRMSDRHRLLRIVRLGEGVDRTGEFAPAALDRLFTALDEYAGILAHEAPLATRFVATSASRDVANRAEFERGVRARIGRGPDVITGTEEAELSFLGATRGLPGVPLPALVVDIGGGSTEFVLGADDVRAATSVDIGCVRLTERHALADPPSAAQVAAVRRDIDAAIDRAAAAVPLAEGACLVGLAGTVTTVAALAHGHDRYDEALLHGTSVTVAQVDEVTERLLGMTRAERAALPVMHPGRVDVIAAGAMILGAALRAGGQPAFLVSERDILDGIVYRLATIAGPSVAGPFM